MITKLFTFIFKVFKSLFKIIYGVLYILIIPIKKWQKSKLKKYFNSDLGNVRFGDPMHTVDSNKRDEYKFKRGRNDRPYVTMKQKKNGAVGLAPTTTKEQGKYQKYYTPLDSVKMPKKPTYIAPRVHERSTLTGEEFKPGKAPIEKKPMGKLSYQEFKAHKKRVGKYKKRAK